LRVTARIDGGARDDLLEQRGIDVPRTRERREHPTRPHEREPEQVDVLVAATARWNLIGRMHELRRIEHDEVELRPAVAQRS
jgi:hypothetical protein